LGNGGSNRRAATGRALERRVPIRPVALLRRECAGHCASPAQPGRRERGTRGANGNRARAVAQCASLTSSINAWISSRVTNAVTLSRNVPRNVSPTVASARNFRISSLLFRSNTYAEYARVAGS